MLVKFFFGIIRLPPSTSLSVVALVAGDVGAALRVHAGEGVDGVPRERRHHRSVTTHCRDQSGEGRNRGDRVNHHCRLNRNDWDADEGHYFISLTSCGFINHSKAHNKLNIERDI